MLILCQAGHEVEPDLEELKVMGSETKVGYAEMDLEIRNGNSFSGFFAFRGKGTNHLLHVGLCG
jgi:hypothetical protein